jgi:hypothetical protein
MPWLARDRACLRVAAAIGEICRLPPLLSAYAALATIPG